MCTVFPSYLFFSFFFTEKSETPAAARKFKKTSLGDGTWRAGHRPRVLILLAAALVRRSFWS